MVIWLMPVSPNLVLILLSVTPLVDGAVSQCRADEDCAHGICVNDRCFCTDFWGGAFCDQPLDGKLTTPSSFGSTDLHGSQVSQVLMRERENEPASLPQKDDTGPCAVDADCSGHGLCRAGICYCVDPFVGARCAFQHPKMVQQPAPQATLKLIEPAAFTMSAQIRGRQLMSSQPPPPPPPPPVEVSGTRVKGLLSAAKTKAIGVPSKLQPKGSQMVQKVEVINAYMRFLYVCGTIFMILIGGVSSILCCVPKMRSKVLYLASGEFPIEKEKEMPWTSPSTIQDDALLVKITEIHVTDIVTNSWFGQPEVFLQIESSQCVPLKSCLKKPVKNSDESCRIVFDPMEVIVSCSGEDIKISVMEQDFIGVDELAAVRIPSKELVTVAKAGDYLGGHEKEHDATKGIKGRHQFKLLSPDKKMVATLHCNFHVLKD